MSGPGEKNTKLFSNLNIITQNNILTEFEWRLIKGASNLFLYKVIWKCYWMFSFLELI